MIFYKENIIKIVNENNVNELDFKDWIMLSDDCEDGLKKWVKFKASDYPDPDCVLKQDAPKCAVVGLNWYSKTEAADKYYIDCIFSFATFFKAFLRYYAGEYMPYLGRIYENYDKLFGDKYKNKFCEDQKINRGVLDTLLEQLNIFARNTHTLGNYMPCPDGKYNTIKGNYYKYKDRLEILYKDIEEPSKSEHKWSSWFDNKKEELGLTNILENENLHEFVFNGRKMRKEDIIPYTEYIKTINAIIENRGIMLVGKLKKNP